MSVTSGLPDFTTIPFFKKPAGYFLNNMMILLLLLKDAADGRRERMTDRSVKVKRRVLHVCNKWVGGEKKI